MQISMKRRLESMEQRITPQEQRIIVTRREGETQDDVDARIERWKAGEDVPQIRSAGPYQGCELSVIHVRYVGTK